jgi:hypothetical protein
MDFKPYAYSYGAKLQKMASNFIMPLFKKKYLISTWKFFLCFMEDDMYNKWIEVFKA